jgi:hypothetical protein
MRPLNVFFLAKLPKTHRNYGPFLASEKTAIGEFSLLKFFLFLTDACIFLVLCLTMYAKSKYLT